MSVAMAVITGSLTLQTAAGFGLGLVQVSSRYLDLTYGVEGGTQEPESPFRG